MHQHLVLQRSRRGGTSGHHLAHGVAGKVRVQERRPAMLLGGDPLHRAHADEARALGRGHHREPAWLDVTQARPRTEHLTELWRESVQRQPGHSHRQHSLQDRAARYVLVLARCLRVAHGHCFSQTDPPPNTEASTRSGPPRPRSTEPRRGTRAGRGNTAEVPHRRRSTRLSPSHALSTCGVAMIRSRDRFNTIRSSGDAGEASRAPRRIACRGRGSSGATSRAEGSHLSRPRPRRA